MGLFYKITLFLISISLTAKFSFGQAPPPPVPAPSRTSFCAGAGEGFHTHPDDCTKFVRCVGNGRFDFDCAPGTVFDPMLEICNWAGAGGAPKDCEPKTAFEIVFGRGSTPSPSPKAGSPEELKAKPSPPTVASRIGQPTTTKGPSSLSDLINQGLKPSIDFAGNIFGDKLKPSPTPTTTSTTTTTTTTTTTPKPEVCTCNLNGSLSTECDVAGNCNCKKNVDGAHCNTCKEGHFNLHMDNKFGCSPCFCFGHSTKCKSAPGYYDAPIRSSFSSGYGEWRAVNDAGELADIEWVKPLQVISIKSAPGDRLFFKVPSTYLGDQRTSYGRRLNFTLWITNERDYRPSQLEHVVTLEGAGLHVSMPIFGTDLNPYPEEHAQVYSFKLDPETPGRGWEPRLTKNEFLKLLSDLSSIKIQGTFAPDGITFLDNVFLETARMRPDAGPPDGGVEKCECPKGHAGTSCEKCAPGFKRANCDGADAFVKCVPCVVGQKCGC